MKLSVKKESCISCQSCVAQFPDHFRFDAESKSECFNPEGLTPEQSQEAISICPVSAIYDTEV